MRNIAHKFLFGLLIAAMAAGCLVQPAAFGQEGPGPGQKQITPEDLEAMGRQAQERFRKEEEARRQQREEAERRERERIAAEKAAVYVLDPELKKAADYFFDHQNRRREVAIGLFEKYLEKHPDTIFKPQVYFHIGQLYSSHARQELGERHQHDLMRKYYQLAVDAYGPKYSDEKDCAWASIVNQPEKTLEDRRKYYDWLRAFNEKLSAEDMYPVVSMEVLAKGYRKSEYWSEEERERAAKGLKRDLPMLLNVTEKNIFYRSKLEELPPIIKLYPGTELARQAQTRLHGDDKRVLETLNESLKGVEKASAQQGPSVAGNGPARVEGASASRAGAEDAGSSPGYGIAGAAQWRWASWWVVGAVLAVLGLGVVVWRRRVRV